MEEMKWNEEKKFGRGGGKNNLYKKNHTAG